MIFGIYCVRDIKSGFQTPMIQVNDDVAIRDFATAVQQSKDVLAFHPADFSLYKIGEFDSGNGKLWSLALLEQLVEATDFVK